jgi:hypothetical protein
MGDNNVGGNGSVEWSVDVDDPKWTIDQPKSPKGRRQGGADEGGKDGESFTITIEVPVDTGARDKFIKDLTDAVADAKGGKPKVILNLLIERNNPDQIWIHWPKK